MLLDLSSFSSPFRLISLSPMMSHLICDVFSSDSTCWVWFERTAVVGCLWVVQLFRLIGFLAPPALVAFSPGLPLWTIRAYGKWEPYLLMVFHQVFWAYLTTLSHCWLLKGCLTLHFRFLPLYPWCFLPSCYDLILLPLEKALCIASIEPLIFCSGAWCLTI